MSTSPDVDNQSDAFRKSIGIEKQQEELLKAKYPNLKVKGGSSLLKKRMAQKQTKYFDSGDYNMARAQMATANKQKQIVPEVKEVTGDHMPTPDEMPRIRKQSQSTLVTGQVYPS